MFDPARWKLCSCEALGVGCSNGGAFLRHCLGSLCSDGGAVCGHALHTLLCAPLASCADPQRALPSSVCVLHCGVHPGVCDLLLATTRWYSPKFRPSSGTRRSRRQTRSSVAGRTVSSTLDCPAVSWTPGHGSFRLNIRFRRAWRWVESRVCPRILYQDDFRHICMAQFRCGTTYRGVGVPSMHGPGVTVCRLFSTQSHAFVSTFFRSCSFEPLLGDGVSWEARSRSCCSHHGF